MKKGIHPINYRLVAFKDMSNEKVFLCRSTVETKESIDINGKKYPLIKIEISSSSHPFYTGKIKFVDSAGRIEKYLKKYSKKNVTLNKKKNKNYLL